MDPNQAVRDILQAAADRGGVDLNRSIAALRQWIDRGGFRPYDWTVAQTYVFLDMAEEFVVS